MRYHIILDIEADTLVPQCYLQDVMAAVNNVYKGRFVQRATLTSTVKCRDCDNLLSADDWAYFCKDLGWSVNSEGKGMCAACMDVCHQEGDDLDDLIAEFCG